MLCTEHHVVQQWFSFSLFHLLPKTHGFSFCSLTTKTLSPHCSSIMASTSPFPSFLSVSSGLLIISPQLMAAAGLRSYLPAPQSSSPAWESCPPASAGLSAVHSCWLLCRRKSTNRWRATFLPVKCKCYKVQHHSGRVLLQIRKTTHFCFAHLCLYILLHPCMHACIHQVLHMNSFTFDGCFKTRTHPPQRLSGWAQIETLKSIPWLKY